MSEAHNVVIIKTLRAQHWQIVGMRVRRSTEMGNCRVPGLDIANQFRLGRIQLGSNKRAGQKVSIGLPEGRVGLYTLIEEQGSCRATPIDLDHAAEHVFS